MMTLMLMMVVLTLIVRSTVIAIVRQNVRSIVNSQIDCEIERMQ